jgi:hypothetical protein
MDINQCPGFFLGHPFRPDEMELNYLVDELEGMISSRGAIRKPDELATLEPFGKAEMDKQMELSRQICNLRKIFPVLSSQRFFEL